jgi:hypothetical protein
MARPRPPSRVVDEAAHRIEVDIGEEPTPIVDVLHHGVVKARVEHRTTPASPSIEELGDPLLQDLHEIRKNSFHSLYHQMEVVRHEGVRVQDDREPIDSLGDEALDDAKLIVVQAPEIGHQPARDMMLGARVVESWFA